MSVPDRVARHMSLRTRMVLSGAVAVVSAAAVTSVFFGLAVRAEMIDNADEVGEVRAEQVADLAQRGILPRKIVGVSA